MREIIATVRAALSGLPYEVYDTDVTDPRPAFPYVLLWGSGGVPSEFSLTGAVDLADRLGVTTVALDADAVRAAQARVRSALDGLATSTSSRRLWLRLADSRPFEVDREVTDTATNRQPIFGADLYRLDSTPL